MTAIIVFKDAAGQELAPFTQTAMGDCFGQGEEIIDPTIGLCQKFIQTCALARLEGSAELVDKIDSVEDKISGHSITRAKIIETLRSQPSRFRLLSHAAPVISEFAQS